MSVKLCKSNNDDQGDLMRFAALILLPLAVVWLVPVMSNVCPYAYAELEGAKLAALPFIEGQFYMAFLMPDEDFLFYAKKSGC